MILPCLDIIRLEDNFHRGTFGALLIAREVFCWTLEPPEFGNMKSFACIPAGQYECQRVVSPKFGTTYEICNVPYREHVLFHAGNVVQDTTACVLLAETQGKLRGNRAILNSGKTFTTFLNTMQPYEKFQLTIKEGWA